MDHEEPLRQLLLYLAQHEGEGCELRLSRQHEIWHVRLGVECCEGVHLHEALAELLCHCNKDKERQPLYRVTRPDLYESSTPGYHHRSARQGHYVEAADAADAARKIALRLAKPDEQFDVQCWDNSSRHGVLLGRFDAQGKEV